MANTIVCKTDTFEQWRVKTNDISSNIGDASLLTTTATNVVSAINEHDIEVGNVHNHVNCSFTATSGQTEVAIPNLVSVCSITNNGLSVASNEYSVISGADGCVTFNPVLALDCSIVVSAVTNNLSTTANNLAAAVNEHQTNIGNVTTLTTTANTNVVSAINELDGEIGCLDNLITPSKLNVVCAINSLTNTLDNLTTSSTNRIATLYLDSDAGCRLTCTRVAGTGANQYCYPLSNLVCVIAVCVGADSQSLSICESSTYTVSSAPTGTGCVTFNTNYYPATTDTVEIVYSQDAPNLDISLSDVSGVLTYTKDDSSGSVANTDTIFKIQETSASTTTNVFSLTKEGTISLRKDLPVSEGGTGASNAADAATNLSVPPNARNVCAGYGLIGGGDLSADRTLSIGSYCSSCVTQWSTNGVLKVPQNTITHGDPVFFTGSPIPGGIDAACIYYAYCITNLSSLDWFTLYDCKACTTITPAPGGAIPITDSFNPNYDATVFPTYMNVPGFEGKFAGTLDGAATCLSSTLLVSKGGTGGTTSSAARTNLCVPPNTRNVCAGYGLTGGGDLTADRSLSISSCEICVYYWSNSTGAFQLGTTNDPVLDDGTPFYFLGELPNNTTAENQIYYTWYVDRANYNNGGPNIALYLLYNTRSAALTGGSGSNIIPTSNCTQPSTNIYIPGFEGHFSGTFNGTVTGNISNAQTSVTADCLTTARSIGLSGDVTGSASFNGSQNITISATVADSSHNHSANNITSDIFNYARIPVANGDCWGAIKVLCCNNIAGQNFLDPDGRLFIGDINFCYSVLGGNHDCVQLSSTYCLSDGDPIVFNKHFYNNNFGGTGLFVAYSGVGAYYKLYYEYCDAIQSNNNNLTVCNVSSSLGNNVIAVSPRFSGLVCGSVSGVAHTSFTGSNGSSSGRVGSVPAPAAADNVKFLRGDGSWASPSSTSYTASNGVCLNTSTNNFTLDTSYYINQLCNNTCYFKISNSKWTSNVNVVAPDFEATSDRNIKTDLEPVENALDLIKKVKIHKYKYKDSGLPGIGVIAQELEELLPEAVNHGDTMTVKYNYLFSVLVQAVQELAEKLEV